jgi:hypothetical protein
MSKTDCTSISCGWRTWTQRDRDYDSISLTQPGVEGITQAKCAIDMAKKMNDHIANVFVKNNPGRFLGFATVPLQDPAAAAKELERAVKELGFVGANVKAIPISATRTRLAISMSNPYGNSGHMSKHWTFQFVYTPEFRCPTSNVSTKVMRGYWAPRGVLGLRRRLTRCA